MSPSSTSTASSSRRGTAPDLARGPPTTGLQPDLSPVVGFELVELRTQVFLGKGFRVGSRRRRAEALNAPPRGRLGDPLSAKKRTVAPRAPFDDIVLALLEHLV